MKYYLVAFIFLTLFSFVNAQHKEIKYPTIEQILELPDEKIDIGVACLIMAKDVYPKMRIEVFDYILDQSAKHVNHLIENSEDPDTRIGMINSFMFRRGWWNDSTIFEYDLDDLDADSTINQFLNGIISTKKGSCITMPMFYYALVDKLNWPVKAVRAPQHFFLRYIVDDENYINIEATIGGKTVTDEHYMEATPMPEHSIKNGVYMRNLSKKEYLASLLVSNARYFSDTQKDLDKAIYYYKLAIKYDPTFSMAFWNLGAMYKLYAQKYHKEADRDIKVLENNYLAQLNSNKQEYVPDPRTVQANRNRRNMNNGVQKIFNQSKISPHIPNLPKAKPLMSKEAIRRANLKMYFDQDKQGVLDKYVPKIEQHLKLAELAKQRAEELGFVKEIPEEFYIKQKRDIENFIQRGHRY